MELKERIDAFARLGDVMRLAVDGQPSPLSDGLIRIIEETHRTNQWFTPSNVKLALEAFAGELSYSQLNHWVSMYPDLGIPKTPKKVAVVMAGNIPMVGFHDMLSILISGNIAIAKTSSKDDLIIREIASVLVEIEPEFRYLITFTDESLKDFDAVIATGSDNSSRYFEYYFSKFHSLIRKNRTGIAFLSGNETLKQLENLGSDVFSYFGLGCRNVTKLYLPEGFTFDKLQVAWSGFANIVDNTKYRNNYEHNKAVSLVNREPFHDLGFVLLKENQSLFSPVGVINYELITHASFSDVVNQQADKIQVIVSKEKYTNFGEAQKPRLWDYSDGIDTIDFLLKIN